MLLDQFADLSLIESKESMAMSNGVQGDNANIIVGTITFHHVEKEYMYIED